MSPFSVRVLEDATTVQKSAHKGDRLFAVEVERSRPISEAEFHSTNCAFALAHFSGVIAQLAQTPAYLRGYRRNAVWGRSRITHSTDIAYHLEGFLVRAVSMLDKMYQLCSAVCHTGLAANAVNERTVIPNHIVVSVGLDVELKLLRKICQPYTQRRNQVVHHHGILDEELRRLQGLLLASRVLPKPRRFHALALYRRMASKLAQQKEAEVVRFVRHAIEACIDIYPKLDALYLTKQRQLRA